MKLFTNLINYNKNERRGILIFIGLFILYQVCLSGIKAFHRKQNFDLSIYEGLFKEFSENENIQPLNGTINSEPKLKLLPTISNVRDTIPAQSARLKISNSSLKEKKSHTMKKWKSPFVNKDKVVEVDINTADQVELQFIKGIGPSFAKRIITYRNMIGGFHSMDQLREVYGLEVEKLNAMRPQITISKIIPHLAINKVGFKELRHPYLTYQQAKIIIAYREQHGFYKDPEDLLKIRILDEIWLERISPYLDFSIDNLEVKSID